jgi:CRP/FNR family cyclic AMP-dependent transcriptional regulator
MSGGTLVRLLDHDPDFANGLREDEAFDARRATVASIERAKAGPWTPDSASREAVAGIVLRGLLVREFVVAGTVSAELLGPGDVILAPASAGEGFVPAEVGWIVLEPLALAWLGGSFEQAARRWPALNRALLSRVATTHERALLLQNLAQMTRVEDRVLLLLWHLAERFGRVGPSGIILPLRLTHRMIARLVGARRPSVTTAILALERAAAIERRPDGGFLLRTEPQADMLGAAAPESPWPSRATKTLVLDELRAQWARNAARPAAVTELVGAG